MKRLIFLLLLIPSLAFGVFTEFYCDSVNGSNLNSGSDAGTVTYTSTNGAWNASTGVFTPSDGSNPVSSGVTVGQFASVYIDGASVGVCSARVTAVTNATNGTITVSTTAKFGTLPTTNGSARTIKVGGALKGPNAASHYPFALSFTSATDASSNPPRINLKNNGSYSITGSGSWSTGAMMQGYTTSVGDGGKATIDTTTNAVSVTVSSGHLFDMIFASSASSGASDLLALNNIGITLVRVVVHGARSNGINDTHTSGPVSVLIEVEVYGNNTGNNATTAGIAANSSVGTVLYNCTIHDNTGSNTSGIYSTGAGGLVSISSVFDTNGGGGGIKAAAIASNFAIINNDFYNNGGDAISDSTANGRFYIANNNFIKNTGAGINMTAKQAGFAYNNGYGAGTQANGSSDTLTNISSSGAVTYANDVTPWIDPANGDFRINLAAAQGTGRGAFTETAASYAGTIGYPDIGAAQAQIGTAFPTPTPTPTPTATPTVTPTPTTPPETSHTFGG